MKYKVFITYAILFVAAAGFSSALHAQGMADLHEVIGKVVDVNGHPLPGVFVRSANGQNEAMSLPDGTYLINVSDASTEVLFYYPGYKTERAPLDGSGAVNVVMDYDAHNADEIVSLGYSSQTRNSITGAVSTIRGEELRKIPTATLSNKMTGMFPGLISGITSASVLGESTWQVIRGISTVNGSSPVVIIDGVIYPNAQVEYLVPDEIESISILKDAAATAVYGIQGSNGMIVIQTKRGYSGDLKVSVFLDQSFQVMTRQPMFIDSPTYVGLRNQAGFNDGLGEYSQFSRSEVDKFVSGEDPFYYPNNDWYKMFMRDYANMQRASVSVTGGNDGVKYFSNINFLRQSSPFQISEKDDYNPTPSNLWINFRSNVDVKINRYLDGYISISGNLRREKTTRYGNDAIYSNIFSQPPTMFGPLTPWQYPDPLDPTLRTGNEVTTTQTLQDPVYGMINRSGYIVNQAANILTQATLSLDMGFLAKGLSLSGTMAYHTNAWAATGTTKEYERYNRSEDFEVMNFSKRWDFLNTPLGYWKNTNFSHNLDLVGNANYTRSFDKHSLDAMAYVFYLQEDRSGWTTEAGKLPYKRQSMGVSALYGYNDRYFLKADLGYSGSDQFSRKNRFITTPAISAAWVISNESFMGGSSQWLSYLKVRASYGVSANDQLGTDQRFLYLDDFRGENQYDGLRGNPDLTAEKLKIQNYGIDVGLFNSLTLNFDYYRSHINNMLIGGEGSYPSYMGIPGDSYPKLNSGRMKNHGFDIGLTYMKKIDPDWTVFAGGTFNYNKNKVIDISETELTADYAYIYRTTGYGYGRYSHQQFGYKIDKSNGNGFFNTPEEIAAAPTYLIGTPRLGDFMYQDLNEDGVIDERDMAPLGYTDTPRVFYSFSTGFSYKRLELSLMFQGAARVTGMMRGTGFNDSDGYGVYNDVHLHAWTAERYAAGEKITAPALSLNESTSNKNNNYYVQNRSYLSLRNVEVAYSLPLSCSNAISAQRIRFTFQIQNLFTTDKMSTDYVDPRVESLRNFQPYRVYNIGVGLIF